jgi:hypothetical protein
MNFMNKIKLIWKGRSIAESLLDIKSRWKEPVFWATLLGNAITATGTLKGFISPRAAIVINALLAAGYNYVRGIEKAQSDGVTPYHSTSEFWLGIGTMVNNALIDMRSGGVATAYLGGTTVVLAHAIAAARDLANMRPKEAAAAGVTPDAK